MLFNIDSNNPLNTFIPAMVLIFHYSKPPIRFYNSIYKVKYMIETLTNKAILPATVYTSLFINNAIKPYNAIKCGVYLFNFIAR